MGKIEFNSIRKEFVSGRLDESDIPENPFYLFGKWMKKAISEIDENANSMVLSTLSAEGKPSSRIVLLKDFNKNGLTFFTNYNSRKGDDLNSNANASLLFYWKEFHRQIRIEGKVEKVKEEVSDRYFDSRPENSRISAMISPQSKIIPDRIFLENKYKEAKDSANITRPANWGGYILKPAYFEFWQGREGRMHDRICFNKEKGLWDVFRLAP